MKRLLGFGIMAFSIINLTAAPLIRAEENPLLGFSRKRSAEERKLEAKFDSFLERENIRTWMKKLSARAHHLGSPYGKRNAEFIASLFKSWGYETVIEEYNVLFPTPKERLLELLEPERYTAILAEPPLPQDSTSYQTAEQLSIYNAYSIDGDVVGDLVYVNYGVPKDYEELEKRGIDVEGKIVIARYGGSWRGIKPKVAAEHGAIGCILYSDPRNDGYFQGDVYPKGAYRNENGAQRGSVADMPLYPGDPLTPSVGATKNAKRLEIKNAKTLTKIPVIPLSYSDALPLLRSLEGAIAPQNWRGALPITYHLGPGPARVHLKVAFNWDIVTAYDVVAKLDGHEYPDEWIIRGNHHDAWVYGADDPLSGLTPMLEEARVIGQLVKSGWEPRRTIIFAAWDGEEPGLLGSTEFVEAHADVLKQKGVAYINSDSNGRGFLYAGGSHTLEKFINQVARDVIDPEKKISVAERARARRILLAQPKDRKEAQTREDLRIYALGSGSDYTPFLQHLGIACLNLGYGGEDGGGSYHSIYDSYSYYTRFGDPEFEYGITLAQTTGRVILRLANADVLPFEFANFTETVSRYVDEVAKLPEDIRAETKEINWNIRNHIFQKVSDPTKTFVVPKLKDEVPYLNFAPLLNAITYLKQATKRYDSVKNRMSDEIPESLAQQLDHILIKSECALTRSEGLPRRPWFVHQVYAPGFYTGYGVKTLPSVREAIEQRNWKEAEHQIVIVAKTLERFAGEIDRAVNLFRSYLK